VVRHLSAAITGDDGDVADIAHMIRFASEALRKYRGVLAKPNLIIGVTLTRIRERTHLAKRLRVINQSQVARVHGSENDLDHRVARQGPVQLVELFPVVYLNHECDPLVVTAFAPT
jgi:hypothetical protein